MTYQDGLVKWQRSFKKQAFQPEVSESCGRREAIKGRQQGWVHSSVWVVLGESFERSREAMDLSMGRHLIVEPSWAAERLIFPGCRCVCVASLGAACESAVVPSESHRDGALVMCAQCDSIL